MIVIAGMTSDVLDMTVSQSSRGQGVFDTGRNTDNPNTFEYLGKDNGEPVSVQLRCRPWDVHHIVPEPVGRYVSQRTISNVCLTMSSHVGCRSMAMGLRWRVRETLGDLA